MDPATSAAQEFLKLGVPGAVIIFMGMALVALWRRLNEERTASANAIAALQEARLADVRKQTEALVNVTTAMTKSAETQEQTQELLRTIATEYSMRRGGRP